jgi:hypothetical protein
VFATPAPKVFTMPSKVVTIKHFKLGSIPYPTCIIFFSACL